MSLFQVHRNNREIKRFSEIGNRSVPPNSKCVTGLTYDSLKIGISRLSLECGKNDFPRAVVFTLQQKLVKIVL
jgi:hypothetical protein